MKMFGIIYKATAPSGKVYIGQTIQTFEARIRGHKKDSLRTKTKKIKFYYALRKYGIENFKWEILEKVPEDLLNEKEVFYIKKYDSHKNGYNSTWGGNFNPMSNSDIRKKISDKLKGRVFTEEWKTKISKTRKEKGIAKGENNPMFGKKGEKSSLFGRSLSKEHKKKIAKSKIGKKRPDVSERFKGRIISEKTKKAVSESSKQRCKTALRDKNGRFVKNG